MKPTYDILFVTHLPSFYKVNLYNEIAKKSRIFVIFIGESSCIRTKDFTQGAFHFEYCILNPQAFEKRNHFKSLYQLMSVLRKIQYRKMVVGGWEHLEFWYLVFCSPKVKNGLALESSIFDSTLNGFRFYIKRLFLSRISLVYPSGEAHIALLNALNYQGKIKKTLGVGIFNYQAKAPQQKHFEGRFLYVGRLAPEKNLKMLLDVFSKHPQWHLTIIGQGPSQKELESIKSANVTFRGHIPNELLAYEYQRHDIFILPSLTEPWGLVVEEALFYGLPVIASDRVGCAKDLISNLQAGALFSVTDLNSLKDAISWTIENYQACIDKVAKIDFQARDAYQVQQYIEAQS